MVVSSRPGVWFENTHFSGAAHDCECLAHVLLISLSKGKEHELGCRRLDLGTRSDVQRPLHNSTKLMSGAENNNQLPSSRVILVHSACKECLDVVLSNILCLFELFYFYLIFVPP
jgi:hypothetical protein